MRLRRRMQPRGMQLPQCDTSTSLLTEWEQERRVTPPDAGAARSMKHRAARSGSSPRPIPRCNTSSGTHSESD